MARIRIKDLPKDMKISKEEMKKVVGGALITNEIQIQSGLRVQLDTTRTKQTTTTSFADVAESGLSKEADLVMSAGQVAAPYVPGGSVLSAAITG